MSVALRHRGPDDEGIIVASGEEYLVFGGSDTPLEVFASDVTWTPTARLARSWRSPRGGIALGHRRLSIIDLSPAGHQPMVRANRYAIVFNGEIYNYLELREELARLGQTFLTGSDTEVILAAYAEWGPSCLSRFNGMWGLAIHDRLEGTLFLARDRFGVKPLYLHVQGDRLAFASEIKAFAALDGWRPRINQPRVLDFLVWTVSDHSTETMFADVFQLAAGHYLKVDAADLTASGSAAALVRRGGTRWYVLPTTGPSLRGEEANRAVRDALASAVKLRLRSDVAVGSCLSGGLDSSSIVCLMSEALGGAARPHTFTAASADAAFDETRYARAVVARVGATAEEITPSPERLFEDLDRLVWHQDEPFVSTSIFAQWCVFQRARETGVIVMLDGQGADEAFGGYRGFFGAYLGNLFRSGQLGRFVREARAIGRTTGYSPSRLGGYTLAYAFPQLLPLLGRLDGRSYGNLSWLAQGVRSDADADPLASIGGRPRSVRDMSLGQLTATNLPMLLRWEDRNSMAFGVEARVPFLDYRVVELALRVSDHDKVGGGIAKRVLRSAMRGLVPDEVLDRRDKMGFVTAEPLWATRHHRAGFREEVRIAVDALPTLFAPSLLSDFDEVQAGRRAFDHRYWRAVSVARWVRRFGLS
jgi:asparagine synthase (glutamine-hydrolysing)